MQEQGYMAFKTFVPIGDSIVEWNNPQIVNVKVLNIVMPKYNVENYANTLAILL